MDRLSPVALVAVLAAGCTEPSSGAGSKSGRVAAVEAAPTADPGAAAEAWCDVWSAPDRAAAFAYPALQAGAAGRPGTARWINMWATWCGPCVEELPRIASFRDRLAAEGARVQLELVAADEAEAVQGFVAKHPAAAGSMTMADPEALATWLAGLGIAEAAGLPIQLFVDADDRLRCARLGGVSDDDYAAVLAVLRAM